MADKTRFPKHFLWGASTASHQVEGGNKNQWTEWEQKRAAELARTAQKRLGGYPRWEWFRPRAERPENYISGRGVEHYERYEEDFDLLESMHMNAFRFGVEWSRLQPEPGVWDEQEVGHYRKYIRSLKKRGIEPILNLWHWTMPVWFSDMGAFEKRKNLQYWDEFVRGVSERLGNDVRHIITLNEPNVYVSFSYVSGDWPPERHNPLLAYRVYRNLMEAHRSAYSILKQHDRDLSVGLAVNMVHVIPSRDRHAIDKAVAALSHATWNWWFINRVRNRLDFIGINYYITHHNRRFKQLMPDGERSDMGWYLQPGDIYSVIKASWRRYKKPIIITENGLADAEDAHRKWWIEETITAMQRALAEGVDLRGYLHWSLLDNFEWKFGWWPKFGLVHVDREHGMKRTIRTSAKWFGERIRELRKG